MNKLPERIRIKDIARLADVSVGTVDRVIHSLPFLLIHLPDGRPCDPQS